MPAAAENRAPSGVSFTSLNANGQTFHAAVAGDPAAPLMLLLHGFPDFWYGWRHQMPAFAAKWRVVAPDQRGYNLSSKPSGFWAYRLHHLVDDAAAMIRALGRQSATVVAHDWGAAVAWGLASRYPELVDRLVVINVPPPHVFMRQLKIDRDQRRRSSYMLFFSLPWLPVRYFSKKGGAGIAKALKYSVVRGRVTDDELAAYRTAFLRPRALRCPLLWYRAGLLSGVSRFGSEELIRPKTLILWGGDDPFLSGAMAEPAKAACRDARIVRIEKARHWPHWDYPEIVNEEIERFLGE